MGLHWLSRDQVIKGTAKSCHLHAVRVREGNLTCQTLMKLSPTPSAKLLSFSTIGRKPRMEGTFSLSLYPVSRAFISALGGSEAWVSTATMGGNSSCLQRAESTWKTIVAAGHHRTWCSCRTVKCARSRGVDICGTHLCLTVPGFSVRVVNYVWETCLHLSLFSRTSQVPLSFQDGYCGRSRIWSVLC